MRLCSHFHKCNIKLTSGKEIYETNTVYLLQTNTCMIFLISNKVVVIVSLNDSISAIVFKVKREFQKLTSYSEFEMTSNP